MQTLNLIQGSPEWAAHRAIKGRRNASEAAMMMGVHPNVSRNEFMVMTITGSSKEFSDYVQNFILAKGHRDEKLALPIAEQIIGDNLSPVTGVEGDDSVSFDGLTFSCSDWWEHKSLNAELRKILSAPDVTGKDLPLYHQIQMEGQAKMCGGARGLFMASDWEKTDAITPYFIDTDYGRQYYNLVEELHCWYTPNHELRERIAHGWDQFFKDCENYQPAKQKPSVVGDSIKDLPAVSYEINGLSVIHNIDKDVKPAVVSMITKFERKPVSDQDFSDLDSFTKMARKAVTRSEAVRATFKARFVDIDAFERSLVELEEMLTKAAIKGEKTFKSEKDARKLAIISERKLAFAAHITELQGEIVGVRFVVEEPDFAKAVFGLKSLESYEAAADTALRDGKFDAEQLAKDYRAKLTWCKENATGQSALFPDLQALMVKPFEDFTLTITSRIEKQKADEASRLEAERVRMEAAAKEKADREAAATIAAAEARIREEEQAKARAEAVALANREQQTAAQREAERAEAVQHVKDKLDSIPVYQTAVDHEAVAPTPNDARPKHPALNDDELIRYVSWQFNISNAETRAFIIAAAERLKVSP
jgi:predicted phage-related endonuclease